MLVTIVRVQISGFILTKHHLYLVQKGLLSIKMYILSEPCYFQVGSPDRPIRKQIVS